MKFKKSLGHQMPAPLLISLGKCFKSFDRSIAFHNYPTPFL